MKQFLLPLVFGLAAAVFGFLYITKDGPAPETVQPEVADQSGTIEEQQRQIAELQAKLAELEVAKKQQVEVPVRDPDPVAFSTEPDTPAEPDLTPEQIERREQRQRMEKMFGEIASNFMRMSTNENAIAQREEMGRMWQQQRQLDRQRRTTEQYSDLLSKFDLTINERKTFVELLAKRGGGNRWGRGGASEEQKAEAEAEIKAFLGDEGYTEYRRFEDTKYGRGRVAELEKALGTGLAMSPEQNEKMVDVFGGLEEFSNEFQRDAGWGRWNRGSEETAVDMDQRLTELETRYNNVIEESADVLDDRQLEALSTHLDNRLKQAENSINMANQWQKNMEEVIPAESREELRKMFEGLGGPGGR